MLFILIGEVKRLRVGEIIKDHQPKEYNKLNSRKKHKKNTKVESLSFTEIQQLMGHSSYRRGKGGSMRQVRYK